jgi:predicted ribosomally synthesized peptide with nif11-like leader
MSNLEQFYNLVQNSQELQQQLGSVESEESFNEMAVRLGQENGYTFTAEDVKAFLTQKKEEADSELSAQELEAVAGGKSKIYDPKGQCPLDTKVTGCLLITGCLFGTKC